VAGNAAENPAPDTLRHLLSLRVQMKKTNGFASIAFAAMLSVGAASSVFAQAKGAPANPGAGKELLAKSGCLACHAVDRKLVGPAHLDVANKYRDVKGAEDKIVAHVRNGGGGVWGPIAMPPHKHIPEADIRTMVRYILTYK
jgi:cytochrome c